MEAIRGAGAQVCDYKRNWLWALISTQEHEIFIFSFLRPSVKAKLGVEFRHSTRNASGIRRKREKGGEKGRVYFWNQSSRFSVYLVQILNNNTLLIVLIILFIMLVKIIFIDYNI